MAVHSLAVFTDLTLSPEGINVIRKLLWHLSFGIVEQRSKFGVGPNQFLEIERPIQSAGIGQNPGLRYSNPFVLFAPRDRCFAEYRRESWLSKKGNILRVVARDLCQETRCRAQKLVKRELIGARSRPLNYCGKTVAMSQQRCVIFWRNLFRSKTSAMDGSPKPVSAP